MIEIRPSKLHGRGVFTTCLIKLDTQLICDVLIFNQSEDCFATKYQYPWFGKTFCICAGFGSFFNHSIIANIKIKSINKDSLTMTFEIIEDVLPDTELLLNYGPGKKFRKSK